MSNNNRVFVMIAVVVVIAVVALFCSTMSTPSVNGEAVNFFALRLMTW